MGVHTVTRVFLLPVEVSVVVPVLAFFNFPPLVLSRSMHCDPVGHENPSHDPLFRTHTTDLFDPVPLPLSTHSASNGQLAGQADGLTHSALDDRPRSLSFTWHS